MPKSILSVFRRLLLALILALPLGAMRDANAVDFTDLWWNSGESGWGVNFIQADDFIFATEFVQGLSKDPTWFSGQLSRGANGVWNGPLFSTMGSYFGGPWNPADVQTTQVGNITFTPSSPYSGVLTYNVGSEVVTKSIIRQTLKRIPLGGDYSGSLLSIFSNCDNPANDGPATLFNTLSVTQTTGGQLELDFIFSGGSCKLAGTFIQNGQLYHVPDAAYTCGTAAPLVAQLAQVKATNQGIEGQWISSVGSGCIETAYFSAVLE